MNPKSILRSWPVVACFLFITKLSVFAQGTAFTYQGLFTQNGTAFSGTVEMQFTLWDAGTNGTQVAVSMPSSALVTVSNGLFTVPVDFGGAPFSGNDRWVQVDARTTLGPFTTLTPRQKVTATPYAIRAANFTGTVGSNQLAGAYTSPVTISNSANVFNGAFTGNGSGLSNLNATSIGGLSASNFWNIGGNAGTTAGVNFLGTTDNQPLELKANSQRVMRLTSAAITNFGPGYSVIYSNAPNVIAGAAVNGVAPGVYGASIGGGGLTAAYVDSGAGYVFAGAVSNYVASPFGTIAGGLANVIQTNASYATIGGGYGNTIQSNAIYAVISGGYLNTNRGGYGAAVGGGDQNTASGQMATVAGGNENTASGFISAIGGGQRNISAGEYATVGGGTLNIASNFYATVPGGNANAAVGHYSFAAGNRAKALHEGAFVWADSQSADFSSTAANEFAIRAAGGVRLSDTTPSISFGTTTRQMLDFYGLGFGVGVQTGTLYARSNTRFSWFKGGTHNDAENNPGTGGSVLMTLSSAGLTVNGTVVSASDRNAKENFEPLNPRDVLDKVATLPLSKWSYKQDSATRHLGPMAQDFYAAFGVGPDDKHIATVDADGVALAAIQGLNLKLEDKDAEIQELKKGLAELKALVGKLAGEQKGVAR